MELRPVSAPRFQFPLWTLVGLVIVAALIFAGFRHLLDAYRSNWIALLCIFAVGCVNGWPLACSVGLYCHLHARNWVRQATGVVFVGSLGCVGLGHAMVWLWIFGRSTMLAG